MGRIGAALFLTDGFEVTEALTPVNMLRRAGVETLTVSITGSEYVMSKGGVCVKADALFEDSEPDADALILPGGPGHLNYPKHQPLMELIRRYDREKRLIAAICAAPTVLGGMGLLRGRRAVCYPSMESGLIGAEVCADNVVRDGHIITSKGPGTATDFALAIIDALCGSERAEAVAREFVLI